MGELTNLVNAANAQRRDAAYARYLELVSSNDVAHVAELVELVAELEITPEQLAADEAVLPSYHALKDAVLMDCGAAGWKHWHTMKRAIYMEYRLEQIEAMNQRARKLVEDEQEWFARHDRLAKSLRRFKQFTADNAHLLTGQTPMKPDTFEELANLPLPGITYAVEGDPDGIIEPVDGLAGQGFVPKEWAAAYKARVAEAAAAAAAAAAAKAAADAAKANTAPPASAANDTAASSAEPQGFRGDVGGAFPGASPAGSSADLLGDPDAASPGASPSPAAPPADVTSPASAVEPVATHDEAGRRLEMREIAREHINGGPGPRERRRGGR